MGLTYGRLTAAVAGAGLLVSATCAMGQDFVAFEGKSAMREGEGGAKKTVEGVDFWSDGAPPRRFTLIGYITDRRQKSGLFGMASMASLEKDVALVAKKNGADAVILMASDAETIGSVGNAFVQRSGNFGSGFGATAAVQKNNSKFAVLKYVSEAQVAPSPPVAAVAPPSDAPAAVQAAPAIPLAPAEAKKD